MFIVFSTCLSVVKLTLQNDFMHILVFPKSFRKVLSFTEYYAYVSSYPSLVKRSKEATLSHYIKPGNKDYTRC